MRRPKAETRVIVRESWTNGWTNRYPEETLEERFSAWFERTWKETNAKHLRTQARHRLRSMYRVKGD